jgi:hypothetical protein
MFLRSVFFWFLLLPAVLLSLCSADDGPTITLEEDIIIDYCVVGGGPSGLHLIALFTNHSIDNDLPYTYRLYEKMPSAGAFFHKYPVSRTLVSRNKRHTMSGSLARRFDAHTLFLHDGGGDELRFAPPQYPDDYFPSAPDYVRYLEDFARVQIVEKSMEFGKENPLHFSTEVLEVEEAILSKAYFKRDFPSVYSVTVRTTGYRKERVDSCRFVIFATGQQPSSGASPFHSSAKMMKRMEKEKLFLSYSDFGHHRLEDYTNKNVLVLGTGRSAVEVVTALAPYAGKITAVNRRAADRGAFFKFMEDDNVHVNPGLWPCVNESTGATDNLHFSVGRWEEATGRFKVKAACKGWEGSLEANEARPVRTNVEWDRKSLLAEADVLKDMSLLFQEEFDQVIACTGFESSSFVFKLLSALLRDSLAGSFRRRKRPLVQRSSRKIVGATGLFVIGAAAAESAGLDSIAAQRALTKAFFQTLVAKEMHFPWPSRSLSMPDVVLGDAIVNRMLASATTFRAPQLLCDVLLLRPGMCNAHGADSVPYFPRYKKPEFAEYFKDVPLDMAPVLARLNGALSFVTLTFTSGGSAPNNALRRADLDGVSSALKGYTKGKERGNGVAVPKIRKAGAMSYGASGPAAGHDGMHYLLSYFDMSKQGGNKQRGGWHERSGGEDGMVLLPSYAHHTFPYRRFSFVRPLQWFLKEIVRLVPPHGDCSRWKQLEKQMGEIFRGEVEIRVSALEKEAEQQQQVALSEDL